MIQSIAIRFQRLSLNNKTGVIGTLQYFQQKPCIQQNNFHTSSTNRYNEPKKWLQYNKKFYPIQKPDEERRPAVNNIIYLFIFFI